MMRLRALACVAAVAPVIGLAAPVLAQSGPWFQPIPFFPFNMPPPPPPPPPGYYPPPPGYYPPPPAYSPPPGEASVDPFVEQPTPLPKPKAAARLALSCDKAKAIVSDYGFTDIEAQSCKGKVYAFGARRDGKSFTVKLSSSSGELTEVKRL
jgi:hypothetical protein